MLNAHMLYLVFEVHVCYCVCTHADGRASLCVFALIYLTFKLHRGIMSENACFKVCRHLETCVFTCAQEYV